MSERRRFSNHVVWISLAAATMGLGGCGIDVEALFLQSADALGRTCLDLLLTDLANDLADAQEADDDGNGGDADDDDGNGDDEGNGGDEDVPFDDLVGDPVAGEPLYASCAACHCADAGGDCLPGAPGVIGASAEALDEFLRGGASHPPSDLSNQEIVDLEAYLATLGG